MRTLVCKMWCRWGKNCKGWDGLFGNIHTQSGATLLQRRRLTNYRDSPYKDQMAERLL